ncbi:hypothetical protein [Pseudomonas sp. GW456-L15]|uniref:hypothetical protein n=1 Tax=Pseudomonas sp. GW456-L15 TaxID=2751353 RepID=UPI00215BE356|nr:hypothetical protein [Pseudomonas sp. GW456-L15]
MKWFLLTAGALLLTGCSYEKTNLRNDTETAKYDRTTSARIRIFSAPETGLLHPRKNLRSLLQPSRKWLPVGKYRYTSP